MKYKVIGFELRKDEYGKEYVDLELSAVKLPVFHRVSFSEARIVDMFRRCKSVDDLPDECKYIHGEEIVYEPGILFHRKYLSNHPATEYRPAIKKGDIMREPDGTPSVFYGLKLFCVYYTDENGKHYLKGHSPEELWRNAAGKLWIPVESKEEHTITVNSVSVNLSITQTEAIKLANIVNALTKQKVVITKTVTCVE